MTRFSANTVTSALLTLIVQVDLQSGLYAGTGVYPVPAMFIVTIREKHETQFNF